MKLTMEQIEEIRALKGKMKKKDIAKLYGIDPRTVYSVMKGYTPQFIGAMDEDDKALVRAFYAEHKWYGRGKKNPNQCTFENIRQVYQVKHSYLTRVLSKKGRKSDEERRDHEVDRRGDAG